MKRCKRCNDVFHSKKGCYCNRCKYINEIERDPIGVAYRRLKSHAKQRGKEFSLTKEQFQEFCIKSEYMVKKGIHKNCLHIDRKDETKGYTIDNIQVLSNTENVKKYAKWISRDEGGTNNFRAETRLDLKNLVTCAPF